MSLDINTILDGMVETLQKSDYKFLIGSIHKYDTVKNKLALHIPNNLEIDEILNITIAVLVSVIKINGLDKDIVLKDITEHIELIFKDSETVN